jgi:outer membrane protein assembly factor BamB
MTTRLMRRSAGVRVLARGCLAGGLLLLLAAQAPAQSRTAIYSTPLPPPAEALRRLNLVTAWYRHVPGDGRRDGLVSVFVVGNDLFAQMRSGLVMCMDAETGVVRWRARPGLPYRTSYPMTLNARSVYVVNGTDLYGLDRRTGNRQFRFRLPGGISAPPVADQLQAYIGTGKGRLYAYYLPRDLTGGGLALPPERGSYSARGGGSLLLATPGGREDVDPEPRLVWEALTDLRLEMAPLVTSEVVLALSPTGEARAFSKTADERGGAIELYRFSAEGRLLAPPGQFGDTAYIGSADANLYALNLTTGRLRWRFTAGTPLTRQPVALEQDVYATSERGGLTRLDRATGETLWRVPRGRGVRESNPDADRFLAANPKFVYATDPSGRLLVLDRKRGVRLSVYDTRHFRFPVVNDVTDRLYLAANNGLIVCLRDRDYPRPVRHRRLEEETSSPTRKRLAAPVTDPGAAKPMTLREALDALRRRYKLKIVVAERAFKEAGVEGIQIKEVRLPKVEARPLGQFLQLILNQVNATYDVIDDTVLIVPGKPRK